ncbi:MAG: glycosyltransferase family 4 protein [Pseudidiomarina maritima]|nr:glycosyltransferase family 4 protein [Pseudidiomarina maritima]
MLHELGLSFIEMGHSVTVLTPDVNSDNKLFYSSIDNVEGVRVIYFKMLPFRGRGNLRRVFSEFMLPVLGFFSIRKELSVTKFDVCINYSPTIFWGGLATLLRKRGVFVYLILRDMFPQWIIDQGILKRDSLAARFLEYFENLNYKSSDFIGAQSKKNLQQLQERTGMRDNTHVLYNWSPLPKLNSLIKSSNDKLPKWFLDIRSNTEVIFFYGGTIGPAQDIMAIMCLARRMVDINSCHFVIVGQGEHFELINRFRVKEGLTNVTISKSVNQKVYDLMLNQSDVGLFSLAKSHSSDNFPGKVMGYLGSGLPVLGIVNKGNELISIINNHDAGMVVDDDGEAIFSIASDIVHDPALRTRLAVNALNLAKNMFDVNKAAISILDTFLIQ